MRRISTSLLLFLLIVITAIFISSGSNLSMAYEKEIKGISSTLGENIVKAGKKMIAVVDFTDLQGSVTELGRFLAEEFSVAFAGAGKGFEVVDRTHLKSILAEHKLSTTGIIDPQTARKLGQIAGVDALITGTITPFGDSIRLSVKVLDTSTARVIGASSGDVAKTKAIEELLARGIETGAKSTEGSAPNIPSHTRPKATAKVEADNYTFEAKGCKSSGQQVKCTIAVTNKAAKTRHFLAPHTILVDDIGNQYTSYANLGTGYSGMDVPPDLPVNISTAYRDIHPDARYGNLILNLGSGNVVLRNIPLGR